MTEPIEVKISDEDPIAYLNEIYPLVNVCGMEMSPGRILRELDRVAFDMSKPDRWSCDNCQKEYEEESDAKECCSLECCECLKEYDPIDSNADDENAYCCQGCQDKSENDEFEKG